MATAAEDVGHLHASAVLQPITNGTHPEASIALDDETQTVLTKKATNGYVLDDATETVDKVTVDTSDPASPAQPKSFVADDSAITVVSDEAAVTENETKIHKPVEAAQLLDNIPSAASDKENPAQGHESVDAEHAQPETEPTVDTPVLSVEVAGPPEHVDTSASDATEMTTAHQPQELEDVPPAVEVHTEQPPSPATSPSLELAEPPVIDVLSPVDNVKAHSDSLPHSDETEVSESRVSKVLTSEEETPDSGPTSVTNDIADDNMNGDGNATTIEEPVVPVTSKPEEAVTIEVNGPSAEVEVAAQELDSPEDIVAQIPELPKSAEPASIKVSEEVLVEPSTGNVEDVVEQTVSPEVVEAQVEVAAVPPTLEEVTEGIAAEEASISEESSAKPVESVVSKLPADVESVPQLAPPPEVVEPVVEPDVVSEPIAPAGIPQAEGTTTDGNVEDGDVPPLSSESSDAEIIANEPTAEAVAPGAEVTVKSAAEESPLSTDVTDVTEALTDAPGPEESVEGLIKGVVESEVVSEPVVPAGIPQAEALEENAGDPPPSKSSNAEVPECLVEPAAEIAAPAAEVLAGTVAEESPIVTDTMEVEVPVVEEVSPTSAELSDVQVDGVTAQPDAVAESVTEAVPGSSAALEPVNKEPPNVDLALAETVPLFDEASASTAPTESVEIVDTVAQVVTAAAAVAVPSPGAEEVLPTVESTTVEAIRTNDAAEVMVPVVEAAESTSGLITETPTVEATESSSEESVTEMPTTESAEPSSEELVTEKATEPVTETAVEDVATVAEESVAEPEAATAETTEEMPVTTGAAEVGVVETIPVVEQTTPAESLGPETPTQEVLVANAPGSHGPTEESTSVMEDVPEAPAVEQETSESKTEESPAEVGTEPLVTEALAELEVEIQDASTVFPSEETSIVVEVAPAEEDSSVDVPIAIEGPTPAPSIMEEPEVAYSVQANVDEGEEPATPIAEPASPIEETIVFGSFIPPEEAAAIEQKVTSVQQPVQEEASQEVPVVVSEVAEEADDQVEHGSFIMPDPQPPATPELVIKTEIDHLTPADSTPLERPKSPWTPSYSVTQQGPGGLEANDEEELGSLDQLPEPVTSSTATTDLPTVNASEVDVIESISPVVEEVATAETVTTSSSEPPVAEATTETEEVVQVELGSFIHAGSGEVEENVTPAEEPAASAAQDITEEVVQVELGSFIPPGSEPAEVEVVAPAPAPVMTDQPVHHVEEESDVVEHGSFIVETERTTERLAVSSNSLTPSGSVTPERPKSPWTPSYSVTKQGPGEVTDDDKELDELDQLPEPVVPTAEIAPEASVPPVESIAKIVELAVEEILPAVVVTETQSVADKSLPVSEEPPIPVPVSEEISAPVEGNEAVTPVEVQTSPKEVQKVSTKPSLSSVDELSASGQPEQGSSLRIDIPTSPTRKRVESTTSSRFFPGGWFSSSPKLPEEGRTSLDVAAGQFVSKSSDNTPTTALPSAVEEDKEKKSRWCTIM